MNLLLQVAALVGVASFVFLCGVAAGMRGAIVRMRQRGLLRAKPVKTFEGATLIGTTASVVEQIQRALEYTLPLAIRSQVDTMVSKTVPPGEVHVVVMTRGRP